MGVDPDEWGKKFIQSLSVSQRNVLKGELVELVAAYPGKSTKGIRNAWTRLGAQSWPRSASLRLAIESWLKALG